VEPAVLRALLSGGFFVRTPILSPKVGGGTWNRWSLFKPQNFAQTGVQAQLQNSITVQAVLCWSEFYNGKWQPTKTSDINRPTTLGTFDATGDNSFDANRTLLRIVPASDLDAPQPGALILHIEELNLGIFSSGFSGSGFILYNTHSLPVRIPQIRPLSAEITRMNIPRLLQHWGA
jgi:hypothetical protein